jgi:hypothetical protein
VIVPAPAAHLSALEVSGRLIENHQTFPGTRASVHQPSHRSTGTADSEVPALPQSRRGGGSIDWLGSEVTRNEGARALYLPLA